ILQQQLPKVEVECLPGNVPKNITVDVSNLSIGDSLTISDVEFSEDFNILTEPEKVIVSVSKAEEIIEEDDDDEFVYETEEAQVVEEDDVEDHQ
ncbi:MAG: 50S ribosomal protein L25, partial [Firmicutes bacterium]|nr:50S ribosomal protein L25 [Bacillota bacterium]